MVNLAVVLIVIAVVMFALGLFVEGATILFWIGLGTAILALLIWASSGRRDPPV